METSGGEPQPAEFDTGLRAEELDPLRPRALETPWGAFSLFAVEGDVRCWQSFCPHMAGPLFQGSLNGDRVTCPWHYWTFSLTTGERVGLPPGHPREGHCEPLVHCAVRTGAEGTLILARPETTSS